MKKIYFLLLAFSFFTTLNAQIVNIPDANFKAKLLEANPTNTIAMNSSGLFIKIDSDNDGNIQLTEAQSVYQLSVRISNISDLTGINSFTNLKFLSCRDNNLTSLDISSLINLEDLYCYSNQLTQLNVSNNTKLKFLRCYLNSLTSIDTSKLTNLEELYCFNNQLTQLNITNSPKLKILHCYSNLISDLNIMNCLELSDLRCNSNKLVSLNVSKNTILGNLDCKNNLLTTISLPKFKIPSNTVVDLSFNLFESLEFITTTFITTCNNLPNLKYLFVKDINPSYVGGDIFSLLGCPNLKYICSNETKFQEWQSYVDSLKYNCHVNSYCSFTPGGTFYTIQGNQKLDSNKNGCDAIDIAIPNLKYTIVSGTTTASLISNSTGNYSIPVKAGTHTITPKLENSTYFTVSPATVNVTFPTQTSPVTQNFCFTPNGVRPDLEVTLLPLQPARPGFDAKYKLVYKNKGNTNQSGSVNLTFNDAVLDLIVANPLTTSQTTNKLTWNFTTLQPFETREITFTMNVNSPMEIPAVNNGAILGYTATITSSATDETPTDNMFAFNQTVVGSYDPNDKTCLEGSVITPSLIGQFVHYTIRFENTGTFAAENVVIKDMIDLTKFDISTLVPTSASHSYTTRISEGNKVEFIFENINLPFDDANNDGYIAFKIKTKPTLVVNDSFSNEASIFFDYNFPIVTNKATSTFKTLGTPDYDFDRYFTVYPNPVKDILNISTKESINTQSMQVYNTLGQLVLVITNAEKTSNIDVSSLESGNYFIQIKTNKGSSSSNFIKK